MTSPYPNIRMDLAGKTRDLPVSGDYLTMLDAAARRTDPALGIRITSGGQAPKGSGGKRTGSTRHDVDETGHSHTADLVLTRDGRDVLPGEDKALYASFLRNASAEGFTGLGHYEWGVHVGGGSEAAWGPSTTSDDLDPEFGAAIAEGRQMRSGVGAVERAPLPPVGAPKASRKLPPWWNTVEQNAATAGVDPDTLYRIGGAESGFRNIGASTSSAHGPFQIVKGTWAQIERKYPELRLTNRFDPEQQARAAPFLLRDYRDFVEGRLGRKITDGEQYLAWFLGPEDAAKVLRAPSGANPRGIITPASIAANQAVFGKITTVDELRQWADGKMAGEGVDGAAAPAPVDMSFTEQFAGDGLSLLDAEPNKPLSPRERVALEKAAKADAYSLGEGIYRALGQEATAQIWTWMGTERVSDPGWTLTPELLKARAADVPEQHLDYLADAQSQADFDMRLTRLRGDLEVERKLGAMGGLGTAIQFGAAIVDPAGWAAGVLAAPIGGAAKAGRLSRIVFGAAEGAAGNLALEAAVSQIKPTWEADQLIYAGAGGLIFGSVFGALRGPRADSLADTTALQRNAAELMRELDSQYGSSSVGAAQNPVTRAPVRTDTDAFLTKNFGEAYGKGAMSALRFDITGKLKASENPLVRALGHVFGEETVGNADGTATFRAVSEDQVKLQKQNETVWYRSMNENWTAYAKSKGLNPITAAHTGGLAEFNRLVMQAARNTDPTVKFDGPVNAQAGTFKAIMSRYLTLAQGDRLEFDGTVRAPLPGFADVTPNDNYVPRLVHWGNFRALTAEVGSTGMTKLVQAAIRAARPDLDRDIANRIGEGYVKRLSSVEAGQELSAGRVFSAGDMDEMRANLESAGVEPDVIDGILRPKETKEAGKAGTPRGKRRELLNENFSMDLPTANGGSRTVRIDELFENDMDRVFQSYNRNMSGQIALAGLRVRDPNFVKGEVEDASEWLIDGIHNRGEWDKLLKQVRDVASSDRVEAGARDGVDADIARLQFIYDGIAGNISKFDASGTARTMRLVRDYIFTRVMGQVGFAQISEIGMITSSVGLKAAIKSMPSLKGFLRDARAGRLADEDARQLEWISTGGTDWIRGMSHIASDEFGTPLNVGGRAGAMEKAEGVMSRLTRAQSAVSGMSSINTYLQRWASKAALYKFLDMSEEGARVNRRRMRVLGLSDEMQDRIFRNIRKHSGDMAGEWDGSHMRRLNLEKWDPDVRASFEHAIFRWTRKMIQENDIRQTNTILGHSVGKLIFQFRGFMFGAWTKNTLHNLHMRDWESLASIITTMTFGGLAYAAQTYLRSLGREDAEEFLKERLSLGGITRAAFQRAGWSSMFPAGMDQMGFLLGFDPLFDTRVTGTPASGLLAFPAANLADDAYKAVRGVTSLALGDDYSRQDARAAWSLLPFQNTLPMLWLFNNTAGRLSAEES